MGFLWDGFGGSDLMTTKTLAITSVSSGPPGSRSRHLGIKSPLLFPMS